jgi:hypothetical protein
VAVPVDDANAHSASIAVNVAADVAYAFLADGMNQSYWALGSLERRSLSDNLYVGTSMFDGTELYVRLRPNDDLRLVDYFLGADPDRLQHLVESRVIPGEELGRAAGTCVVTNTHWRPEDASTEEWTLTYYLWKTEVYLIKGFLERAAITSG